MADIALTASSEGPSVTASANLIRFLSEASASATSTTASADLSLKDYFGDCTIRRQIHIDYTKIDSGITGSYLQMFVSLSNDATLGAGIVDTTNGYDIMFFDYTYHSFLPYEKISFSYTSASVWSWKGWVRVPSVSSTVASYILLGIGLTSPTDMSNKAETFPLSDGFVGVFHFAANLKDSTTRLIDGVASGTYGAFSYTTTSPTGSGYGLLVDVGSNYKVNLHKGILRDLFAASQWSTVTCWFKPISSSSTGYFWGKSGAGSNSQVNSHLASSVYMYSKAAAGSNQTLTHIESYSTITAIPNGTWTRFNFRFKSGTSIYISRNNCTQPATSTTIVSSDYQNPDTNVYSHMDGGSSSYLAGPLAELWFRNEQTVDGRLKTEYTNQLTPTTFFAIELFGVSISSSPVVSYSKPMSTGRLEVCPTISSSPIIGYSKPIANRADVCIINSTIGGRSSQFGSDKMPWYVVIRPRSVSSYSRILGLYNDALSQYLPGVIKSESLLIGNYDAYIPGTYTCDSDPFVGESGILNDLYYWPRILLSYISGSSKLLGTYIVMGPSTFRSKSEILASVVATSLSFSAPFLGSKSEMLGYRRESIPLSGTINMLGGYVTKGYGYHQGLSSDMEVVPGEVADLYNTRNWRASLEGVVNTLGVVSAVGESSFPSLKGTVVSEGDPCPCLVVLYNILTKTPERSMWCDHDGTFEFRDLIPGTQYLVGIYDVYGEGNSIFFDETVIYTTEVYSG